MSKDNLRFDSKLIHGGQIPDKAYGAVVPPIYQTSTFKQDSLGVHKGYEYSRSGNPTRAALEGSLASIESGNFGFAFASGLAAIDAVMKLLNPGDEVISADNLYGGTHRMFTQIYQDKGVKFHFVDAGNPENIRPLVNAKTRIIWIESPTNPLLQVVDIKKIAEESKQHKILLVVDNTFASPYLQRPLEMGADIVMHSATKYIGGHSDLVMGALIVSDKELADRLYFIQKATGAIPGPMDCFLALRGIKTLALRMERHCENAAVVAAFLESHPRVEKVYWPGLKSNPDYALATAQMKHYGGVVSFVIKGNDREEVVGFVEKLELFSLAESLGGVESLVAYPTSMSHGGMTQDERERMGVTDGLIRLSVGIEDSEDLVADLANALKS
ncbi:trans-sulfuration enzyme family protein [Galbibacter sp.]|jgi:cystathionine beta-lyase|uniref:trans-sulfuration enzyme family protein n=1 Tax=Galbibacter sp. TaxID=2918471 RepID=UPI003A90D2AD